MSEASTPLSARTTSMGAWVRSTSSRVISSNCSSVTLSSRANGFPLFSAINGMMIWQESRVLNSFLHHSACSFSLTMAAASLLRSFPCFFRN